MAKVKHEGSPVVAAGIGTTLGAVGGGFGSHLYFGPKADAAVEAGRMTPEDAEMIMRAFDLSCGVLGGVFGLVAGLLFYGLFGKK